jgi:predicted membrane protein
MNHQNWGPGGRIKQRWGSDHGRENSGSEMTGLIIILIGFGLLMNTMGFFPFGPIFSRFWLPMLFIAIGVIHLSKARGADGRMGGLFWIGVGALFFFSKLNYFDFNIWRMIGPLIVIWIGASILTKGMTRRSVTEGNSLDSSDTISATAILGEFNRKCTSQQFKGGDVTTILGGGRIDLREASFQTDSVTLDVFAIIGGIEVLVPQDWVVENRVTPILGGCDDATRPPKEAVKRLVVRGTTIIGGVELKN